MLLQLLGEKLSRQLKHMETNGNAEGYCQHLFQALLKPPCCEYWALVDLIGLVLFFYADLGGETWEKPLAEPLLCPGCLVLVQ